MIATIIDKKEIAENTLQVTLAVPEEFSFEAGQYIRIFLPNGQKRYFSIASSPNQKGSVAIATRMSESKFKNFLREAPLGTEIEVQGPWGDLVLDKMMRSYHFVAGGIGITPFVSMLRYVQEEKLDYNVELFYFNHDRESTAYYDELETLARQNPNLKIDFVNSSPSPSLLKRGEGGSLYYAAGPPGFVNTVYNLLQQLDIPASQIMTESYTGY